MNNNLKVIIFVFIPSSKMEEIEKDDRTNRRRR
jgi:hypothetical protein